MPGSAGESSEGHQSLLLPGARSPEQAASGGQEREARRGERAQRRAASTPIRPSLACLTAGGAPHQRFASHLHADEPRSRRRRLPLPLPTLMAHQRSKVPKRRFTAARRGNDGMTRPHRVHARTKTQKIRPRSAGRFVAASAQLCARGDARRRQGEAKRRGPQRQQLLDVTKRTRTSQMKATYVECALVSSPLRRLRWISSKKKPVAVISLRRRS